MTPTGCARSASATLSGLEAPPPRPHPAPARTRNAMAATLRLLMTRGRRGARGARAPRRAESEVRHRVVQVLRSVSEVWAVPLEADAVAVPEHPAVDRVQPAERAVEVVQPGTAAGPLGHVAVDAFLATVAERGAGAVPQSLAVERRALRIAELVDELGERPVPLDALAADLVDDAPAEAVRVHHRGADVIRAIGRVGPAVQRPQLTCRPCPIRANVVAVSGHERPVGVVVPSGAPTVDAMAGGEH